MESEKRRPAGGSEESFSVRLARWQILELTRCSFVQANGASWVTDRTTTLGTAPITPRNRPRISYLAWTLRKAFLISPCRCWCPTAICAYGAAFLAKTIRGQGRVQSVKALLQRGGTRNDKFNLFSVHSTLASSNLNMTIVGYRLYNQ